MTRVIGLLVCGIIVCALPGAIDYTLFLWRERTPVLRWRLDIVYACFDLFLMAVVVRTAWELGGLVTVRRREAA